MTIDSERAESGRESTTTPPIAPRAATAHSLADWKARPRRVHNDRRTSEGSSIRDSGAAQQPAHNRADVLAVGSSLDPGHEFFHDLSHVLGPGGARGSGRFAGPP